MKTKLRFFRLLMMLILSASTLGVWAQSSQTLTQNVCSGTEPYLVTPGDSANTFLWSISTGISGTDWTITTPNTFTTNVIWANPAAPVTYTLSLTETNGSGCTTIVSMDVTVNPLPVALVLTGSEVCAGDTTTITSTTSVSGIKYQLFNASNATVGDSIDGTNAALIWSPVDAGTGYYVVGTNATTNCVSVKSNAVNVVVNSLPIALVLTGSEVCAGDTTTITSTTSVTGIDYQLFNTSDIAVGDPKAGTDAALIWSTVDAGTGYYVVGTNATTNCVSVKSNAVNVVVNSLPIALVLTGSEVCAGDTTTITSSTSVTGINYQLFDVSNVAVGDPKAGTDAALIWSTVDAGTGYYVVGTNATTNCVSVKSNAVNVVVNPLPTTSPIWHN